MKKLIPILSLLLCAAFPTHTNTETCDMADITGNYNNFSWYWCESDSQTCIVTIASSDVGVDMSSYNTIFRIQKKTEGGNVNSFTTTNITISTSNLYFSVAYSNIPDADKYLVEILAWEGDNTNAARSVAQGKLVVFTSLH